MHSCITGREMLTTPVYGSSNWQVQMSAIKTFSAPETCHPCNTQNKKRLLYLVPRGPKGIAYRWAQRGEQLPYNLPTPTQEWHWHSSVPKCFIFGTPLYLWVLELSVHGVLDWHVQYLGMECWIGLTCAVLGYGVPVQYLGMKCQCSTWVWSASAVLGYGVPVQYLGMECWIDMCSTWVWSAGLDWHVQYLGMECQCSTWVWSASAVLGYGVPVQYLGMECQCSTWVWSAGLTSAVVLGYGDASAVLGYGDASAVLGYGVLDWQVQ